MISHSTLHRTLPALFVAISFCVDRSVEADSWPNFRGAHFDARARGSKELPARIGPHQNVVWKTQLPAGHSSPAVVNSRIYLTGVREEKLVTFALDPKNGRTLWEREAPLRGKEAIHRIGSLAQPSPAADDERVVCFFGSSGLLAYGRDGEPLWHLPMGPFKNDFGAGSSPIIVDDWVILNQDHDTDSFLMAIDKRSGKQVWRTDRSIFPRGYSSPIVWNNAGKRQIVVGGTLRMVGYTLESGKEAWSVSGFSRLVNTTPTIGSDQHLYAASWTSGGDDNDRFKVLPFSAFADEQDANQDGVIVREEMPDGPLKVRFNQIDRDKTGTITKAEYEEMRSVFDSARNVALRIQPGGKGDITSTHVTWRYRKMLPYVPSPLVVGNVFFMIKNGGIVSTLNAETGEVLKQGRVTGRANYYSSPVYGDGKIYVASERGELSVVTAEPEWKEVHTVEFEEEIYATPAIVDGRIYLRTANHLYCFGLPE